MNVHNYLPIALMVCVHAESEIVHVWRGGVWCPVSTMELSREMVAIYSEHRATFSKRVINNAVEALKVIADPMGSRPVICYRSLMVCLT